MKKTMDSTITKIHELASDEAIRSAFRIASDDLDKQILRNVARPLPGLDNLYECIVTLRFLDACRQLIENTLTKAARGYSSLRWLWYLRRLPEVIDKDAFTKTVSPDLAELISSIAGGSGSTSSFNNEILVYDTHASVINRVLRFFGGTVYLDRIYQLSRQASLGVSSYFAKDALPIPKPSPEQQRAMSLFDKRIAGGGRPFGRLGTDVTSNNLHDMCVADSVLIVYQKQKAECAVFGATTGEFNGVEVYARYLPQYHTLNELKNLNADPRLANRHWWPNDAGSLLLLLRLANSLLVSHPFCLAQLYQYGYLVVRERIFKEITNANITNASEMVRSIIPNIDLPSNADELLCILKQSSGSLWPTPRHGLAIRCDADLLCLDLYRATSQLTTMFEFPRLDGDAPNARSKHFERIVQETIDASPWSPGEELRKTRTLQFGGRVKTDLDAKGEFEDALLLVDCYSTAHSAGYEIGDHNAVWNIASAIQDKVIKWTKMKESLEASPVGDNYDFSKYRNYIAIVCTPYPFYVEEPATKLAAPGLLVASSLSELASWLGEKGHPFARA